jgi:hypothetical protein
VSLRSEFRIVMPVTISAFCFLRLVYPMLPVSLDCPLLVAPSVFSYVYLDILIIVISNESNEI